MTVIHRDEFSSWAVQNEQLKVRRTNSELTEDVDDDVIDNVGKLGQ